MRQGVCNQETLDYWPIPDDIFVSLAMDFLSLPECKHAEVAYDFCFVIVDRLSGYICAIPCQKKGLTAQVAADLFLRHSVSFMGVPLEILSDNDNLITSEFFTALCAALGIVQHRAVIYRPKGNGRAERALKVVVTMLRLVLCSSAVKAQWVHLLPWCVFLMNSLPGIVVGHSPHRVVFGRELLYPGELPPIANEPNTPDFLAKVKDLRLLVHDDLMRRHQKLREKFELRHRDIIYVPGDRVWVRTLAKDHAKMDPLWCGPCEILEHICLGKYRIASAKGPEVLHSNALRPYREDLQ